MSDTAAAHRSTRSLTVTAFQWQPGDNPDDNLRDIARHACVASDAGSTLVVFPAYSHRHLVTRQLAWTAASESLDGPFVPGPRGIAADLGVTLVAGIIESSDITKPDNTQVVATSRKINLYDAF